jgi:hypothetical protein
MKNRREFKGIIKNLTQKNYFYMKKNKNNPIEITSKFNKIGRRLSMLTVDEEKDKDNEDFFKQLDHKYCQGKRKEEERAIKYNLYSVSRSTSK